MSTNNINYEERPEMFILSKKKNGQIFCPEKIPRKRYKTRIWLTVFIMIACFIAVILLKGMNTMLNGICCGILTMFLTELIFRLVLLVEESCYHFKSRYQCTTKLIKHVFAFPWYIVMIVLMALLSIAYQHMTLEVEYTYFLLGGGLLLFTKIISLEDAPIYTSLKIEHDDGLNYGSCMAHSIFYGYLKEILPKTGTSEKNLIEQIEVYSDSQGVPFLIPKLFLLIPRSCVCHISLKDDKFPDIEECTSLEEKMKTVAAVQNRVYKNSVYKVFDKVTKERLYVCCEYATPLRTFQKAIDSNGPHQEYFKAHKHDIVLQFYLKLKELLENDPSVKDYCELIYYDDYDEENKEFRDVAKIIVSTIRRIQKDKKNL